MLFCAKGAPAACQHFLVAVSNTPECKILQYSWTAWLACTGMQTCWLLRLLSAHWHALCQDT
jgi:hypothetical protein